MGTKRRQYGFTIVELLIVIVVIGVLAAIVIVAYNGITAGAKVSKVRQDMSQMNKQIQAYYARNGQYPSTSATMVGGATALADANCTYTGAGVTATAQWIPNISGALPQSDQSMRGVSNASGCYIYLSNGTEYVLSAWNMLPNPSTESGYRRLGFRETSWMSAPYYLCNHAAIGGAVGGGAYNANNDHYKRSVTYTSYTSCNETPPSGA
jgi:prepilin-type N-terminal cleavage/methylation domain-containing protein